MLKITSETHVQMYRLRSSCCISVITSTMRLLLKLISLSCVW